ncbi:MAG: YggS family pyridoxal phosphate-dependent enzyme [Rikenellaceae bacterium]
MSIKQNLETLLQTIPANVKLVAVSKTQSSDAILQAYECGQRIFGENRHKELIEKVSTLPKDIIWHYIGAIQRSNVKYVVPRVSLIHSVDSDKLLEEINREAAKCSKVMDVLFEVHVASEQSKSGWSIDELNEYMAKKVYRDYLYIRVRGLMAMATNTDDQDKIRAEFNTIANLYKTIKSTYFKNISSFDTLSAGMSSDYQIAIECGSNMVRLGSKVFK